MDSVVGPAATDSFDNTNQNPPTFEGNPYSGVRDRRGRGRDQYREPFREPATGVEGPKEAEVCLKLSEARKSDTTKFHYSVR